MNILKQYINTLIQEKRRAEKAGVPQEKSFDSIKQYVDKGYFFHFSNLNKLGINPTSKYNTPLGIYGYPLNAKMFTDLKNDYIPFASERLYIHIFAPKEPNTILNTETYSDSEYEYDKNEIKNMLSQEVIKEIDKGNYRLLGLVKNPAHRQELLSWINGYTKGPTMPMIHNIADAAIEKWESESKWETPIGKLWNVTRMIGEENAVKNMPDKKKQLSAISNSNAWARILEKLGYTGVIDQGKGIIHKNEPTQAVFFRQGFVEQIATIENPALEYQPSPSTRTKYRSAKYAPTDKIMDVLSGLRGEELLKTLDKFIKKYGRDGTAAAILTNKIEPNTEILFLKPSYPAPFLDKLITRIAWLYEDYPDRLSRIKNIDPKITKDIIAKIVKSRLQILETDDIDAQTRFFGNFSDARNIAKYIYLNFKGTKQPEIKKIVDKIHLIFTGLPPNMMAQPAQASEPGFEHKDIPY
jgi:hypothetical protein